MATNKCYWKGLLLIFTASLIFSSCRTSKTITEKTKKETILKDNKEAETINNHKSVDKAIDSVCPDPSQTIQTKYAGILEETPKDLENIKLLEFIDHWYGVPYKYGGRSKKGVDCSNFVSLIYDQVYGKTISGSSASLINLCSPVKKEALKEGDLVFFKIQQDKVSHVGFYLRNNKFVHATTKGGVMINDLDEVYYQKYFYKAGRVD